MGHFQLGIFLVILTSALGVKAQIPTQLPQKETAPEEAPSDESQPLEGVAVIDSNGAFGANLKTQMSHGFQSPSLAHVYDVPEKSPYLGLVGDLRLYEQPFNSDQTTEVSQASPYGLYAYDETTFVVGRWDFLQGGSQVHDNATAQPGEAVVDVLYMEKWIHPMFRVRAGHQRLPVGRYNLNDDPASFLSVERPEVESQLIPGPWHDTGVMAWGVHPSGWSYHFGLFQSLDGTEFTDKEFLREGRRQGADDPSEDLLAIVRGDWTRGPVQLGATFLRGETDQNDQKTSPGDVKLDKGTLALWEIHLKYQRGPFLWSSIYTEGRLEESQKMNASPNQPGHRAAGYSSTLGVDALHWWGASPYHWIWFAQYTEYNLHAETHSTVTAQDSLHKTRTTLGWNFKQEDVWVAKAQYKFRKNREDQENDLFQVSLGLKF